MARDDCGRRTGARGRRIVHTRPVHAVMAVHTVYQSNAYRIDFNICVRKWEKGGEGECVGAGGGGGGDDDGGIREKRDGRMYGREEKLEKKMLLTVRR